MPIACLAPESLTVVRRHSDGEVIYTFSGEAVLEAGVEVENASLRVAFLDGPRVIYTEDLRLDLDVREGDRLRFTSEAHVRDDLAEWIRTVEVAAAGRGRLLLATARFPRSELHVDEDIRSTPPRSASLPGMALAIAARQSYRDVDVIVTGRILALEPRMRRLHLAVHLFDADGEPIHADDRSHDLEWGAAVFQQDLGVPVGRWGLAHEVGIHLGVEILDVAPCMVLQVADIPMPREQSSR